MIGIISQNSVLLGMPATTSNWSNLTVQFYLVDGAGVNYHLRPPHTYSFGRDEMVNFQINDVLTSRRHCELRWEAERGWLVVDLGSRNGTFLGGKRLEEAKPLKDQDQLRVGAQHFTYLALPSGADVASYVQGAFSGNTTCELAPGEAPHAGGVFRGRVDEGGLLPLLEFLLMAGKNGRLDLDGDIARRAWFVAGAPRDARFGDKDGDEALRELVKVSSCGFSFHEGQVPPRGECITGDPRALIGSIARGASIDADDLDRAQGLQARLLERIPNLAGYDIGVRYNACSGVGGDFYDIGPLPDGRVLVTLGDVSGHGIQGALVVAMAVKTLRLLRNTHSNPVELLVHFNNEVMGDLLPSQFMTIFLAAFDPATGHTQVVLAGHHPGFLVTAAGKVSRVGLPGTLIGMLPGKALLGTLQPVEFTLEKGSVLFQCTDGLLEGRANNSDEEYGTERLELALAQRDASKPARALLDHLAKDLNAFTGSHQDDDLTFLALAREP